LPNREVGNGFLESRSPLEMSSRFEQATCLQVRSAHGRFRAGQFSPLEPTYVATADRRRPTILQSDCRAKVNFVPVDVYWLNGQWTLTVVRLVFIVSLIRTRMVETGYLLRSLTVSMNRFSPFPETKMLMKQMQFRLNGCLTPEPKNVIVL
jgi:hypothetical protein